MIFFIPFFLYAFDENIIKEHIKNILFSTYKTHNIIINNIYLAPSNKIDTPNSLPIEIGFSQKDAQKERGTFWVIFSDGSNKKKLFFKYQIDATLEVLKTKEALKDNILLTTQNTKIERVQLKNIPFELANSHDLGNFETASYMPKDTIIFKNRLKAIDAVKMGERVFVNFISDGISIYMEATAKEKGKIGDIITIQTKDKKLLKAKVIGKGSVEIR